MAKYELKLRARELRKQGESVREIAKLLEVSKSTVSLWVRDIILSVEQYEKLKHKSIKGKELGRLKGALIQKQRRLELIEQSRKDGIKEIGELKDNEFFVAGLALYWAEGCKKTREVRFCNSDVMLVNFMIAWLEKFFRIDKSEIMVNVGINEIHRDREAAVKEYWHQKTGVPYSQFRSTSFKKSISKKLYENHNEHYGTLNVDVLKPARFYYKIMGLIEGLAVSQGSSIGRAMES